MHVCHHAEQASHATQLALHCIRNKTDPFSIALLRRAATLHTDDLEIMHHLSLALTRLAVDHRIAH